MGVNQNTAYGRYLQTHGKRGFDWRLPALALGAPLAAAAAPALFSAAGAGGAGAASLPAAATQGVAFSAAPAVSAGGGMTLGNFLNIANLGIGGVSSWMGQRANNRALNQQTSLAEREMQMRQAADAEARAEQRRQFDATQANEARRLAAEDEERKFNRSKQEYELQLIREREARSQQRRQRLAQFLGIR